MESPKNPFVHVNTFSKLQKLKMTIIGVTLLPVRLVFALLFIVLSTTLAYFGLYNLDSKEFEGRPFIGWRLYTRKVICALLRFMFFICGFHRVRIIGRQASPKEAKILAVAPHSTFFDALPVVVMGAPSVVAKAETSNIPFWGSLIKYTQPVLVHRNDPNSRQNTLKQIVERSDPNGDWQQVLIFPEGTCTNRSCLITFRTGAFVPGIAVQPVVIRYDNIPDTVTWTWEGVPAWKVIVHSLTQLNLNCTIQFLEPYVPDATEIQDSKIFASNVRQVMADTLKIPTTDCNYFDYLRIEKSKNRAKALQRLQRKLEEPLLETTKHIDTNELEEGCGDCDRATTIALLARRIGAAKTNDNGDVTVLSELTSLVNELDVESAGFDRLSMADTLRHFRLWVVVSSSDDIMTALSAHAFRLFDSHLGVDKISVNAARHILQIHFFLSARDIASAIEEVSKDGDIVDINQFTIFISQTKPQYLKAIKALEGQLTASVKDLWTKSASFTAEMMAARFEKVAASGSSLVSDMSDTLAAGRYKVTDALSSAVTSLHKRTDSCGEKKSE